MTEEKSTPYSYILYKIRGIRNSLNIVCNERGIIYNSYRGCVLYKDICPSINYGSIMMTFCVGYTMDYTMSVSLQILRPLAADFDGKSLIILTVFSILNMLPSLNSFNCWKAYMVNQQPRRYLVA